MRSAPAQLADHIYNGSRDTRVFVRVHKTLLDLGPCCAQRLGVHKSQSVQGHKRLLSDIRMAVAQSRQQVCQRRERQGRRNDVGKGCDR